MIAANHSQSQSLEGVYSSSMQSNIFSSSNFDKIKSNYQTILVLFTFHISAVRMGAS